MFLFSPQYSDVATLASLPKHTGGSLFHYPGFNMQRDGARFTKDLSHVLTRETAWEAVMRVRATRGMRVTNFYGNYFIRGSDLLALPNCNSDATFGVQIAHDDKVLSSNQICVQAALLYTTSSGVRRIRVQTMAAPVTTVLADLYRSVNSEASANLLAKVGAELAIKSGFQPARVKLQRQCVDIVRGFRSVSSGFGQQASQLQLPPSMQLLPLYTMSLLKCPLFRGGNQIRADERAYHIARWMTMPISLGKIAMYPRMFALHTMPPEAGKPDEGKKDDKGKPLADENNKDPCLEPVTYGNFLRLPPLVGLSAERLSSDGCFLMDAGLDIFLWIGRAAPSELLSSLLGVPSLEGVDSNQVTLQELDNEYNHRVNSIVKAIRDCRPSHIPLHIVKEGEAMEHVFFRYLVEDRANFQGGQYTYAEFLNIVMRQSSGAGGTVM
jgi:protein transport protein SEC24